MDRLEKKVQWDEVIVANFFYESVLMPIAALRGRIVKVLAFIDSGQIGPNVVIGDEAEKIAGDWGFAEEIAAMRKYDAEHELQEQQQTTHESALFAKIQQRLTNNDATESFNVGK